MDIRPTDIRKLDTRKSDRFPLRHYASRRMLVLAGLGFASGLPSAYKLLGSTLAAWMLTLGVDVSTVTLLSLVTLPIGLKVLWAPLLDRYALPFLGRRRGWIVLFQAALAAGLLGMALAAPERAGDSLTPLVVAALVVAVLSASQDIVADAYRTDVLEPSERGAGAAVFVNGYRIALLVAGSGALLLADHLPWPVVYGLLAVLLLVGVVAALLGEEPPGAAARPATLREAVVEPWRDFVQRLGRGGVAVLLFVALFKLPDSMAATLTMPLLKQGIGFSNAEIAVVRDGIGLVLAILGALLGGPLVARFGLLRSLVVFGVLQAASNLGFCALAAAGRSMPLLVAVVAVENVCQGLTTAGFLACLMSLCNRRYSATQFALFTGVMFLVGALAGAPTGRLVEAVGYGWAFALSAAAGLPGMLLLAWLPLPKGDGLAPPEGAAP